MSKNDGMNITEFLEARITEDEAAARAATDAPWYLRGGNEWLFPFGFCIGADDDIRGADAEYIAHHDPARALAECAAKRAIAGLHKVGADQCDEHNAMFESITCPTIRALAAIYKDHLDYQQEWEV